MSIQHHQYLKYYCRWDIPMYCMWQYPQKYVDKTQHVGSVSQYKSYGVSEIKVCRDTSKVYQCDSSVSWSARLTDNGLYWYMIL